MHPWQASEELEQRRPGTSLSDTRTELRCLEVLGLEWDEQSVIYSQILNFF